MPRRYRVGCPLMAAVLMAALGLAGCGNDQVAPAATSSPTPSPTSNSSDDSTPSPVSSKEEPSATPSAASAAADLDDFCATFVDVEEALKVGPEVDEQTATDEEALAAYDAFAEEMDPILDDLVASAPNDIAPDVETRSEGLRGALEFGDDLSTDSDYQEAEAAVTDYVFAECGFEVVEVTAAEYSFQGVPLTIPSGVVTGFRFRNQGAEVHEMLIYDLAGDDRPIEDLRELVAENPEGVLTFVGGARAAPAEGDRTFQRLVPGRYALVCFVPVGTTSLEQLLEPPEGATDEAAPEPGPPHFTQGMVFGFTVA